MPVLPPICSSSTPGIISEVISGVPRLAVPYTELARYVAEYRNYHWEFVMTHRKSAAVVVPERASPYPLKSDEISDRADADSGRNFGRIARSGLLDEFVTAAGSRLLGGIPAKHWRRFLKMFTETATETDIERIMASLATELDASRPSSWTTADVDEILEHVRRLAEFGLPQRTR